MSHSRFLKIDLKSWVFGTIKKYRKVKIGMPHGKKPIGNWAERALKAVRKGCPKVGTRTLYELGRIKNTGIPFHDLPLRDVWNNYSRNGAYAVLALDILSQHPDITETPLWRYIQGRIRDELRENPAASNQGAPTVAYKLWHLDLINRR